MKRIFLLATAAFILFSSSIWQEVNPEEAIIGKWEFEKVESADSSLPDVPEEVKVKRLKQVYEVHKNDIRVFNEDNIWERKRKGKEEVLETGTFSLSDDTIAFNVKGTDLQGLWRYRITDSHLILYNRVYLDQNMDKILLTKQYYLKSKD